MSFDQEKWRAETKCNVCDRQGVVGVASSRLGAISFAFCQECLEAGAEPEQMLVYTHFSTSGNPAGWVRLLNTWYEGKYVAYDDFVEVIRANPEKYPDPFEEYEAYLNRKQTAEEWLKEAYEGVEVLDPDGWRGEGRPNWYDPITRDQFEEALSESTCKYPKGYFDEFTSNA